ncbi:MAG: hypothetical protein RMJ59_00390 [Candidatus Nitrosocaldus sp.]|nr:hypothetical protein [Candidatus Nitrosocaldus sp.]MCS7140890.1 hypothetical protein [Candidatus Nitrosocaldus sp.]MDW7999818.1 hypothetical protein [Candidatus Nitrosocaldus sp.]MDW8274821.1 hypothetical protein [Candidatus Nitrosocaldus sp.]
MAREMEVPKDARPIMLDGAEETILGDPMGARRQYRYGNLHIREYDDRYVVHMDRVDPRRDPLMHIVLDAPELIVATALGIYSGARVGSMVKKARGGKGSTMGAIIAGMLASIVSGYTVYLLGRFIKGRLMG